ncbi:unnamed protein product, partial [Mesorhabditis spiculigera]
MSSLPNINHLRRDSSNSNYSGEQTIVDGMIEKAVLERIDGSKQDKVDRLEQLSIAIAVCKEKLRDQSLQATPDGTPTESLDLNLKKLLMEKLVEYGLEKQNLQDAQEQSMEYKKIRGHDFTAQSARGKNPCCEVCLHTIWRLVQYWRRCRTCGMRVHEKCLDSVKRDCASMVGLRVDFEYDTTITPELGLHVQKFRCAECEQHIVFDSSSAKEPRLCGLTGLYYCPDCHWNDEWPIPARLIHNMDPTPHPVCRSTKQLLAITQNKPLISLHDYNPRLFALHSGLKKVHRFRKDFLVMKCYFVSCKNARSLRILQYLRKHQHFVEDSRLYTLNELRDISTGRLCNELEDIHTVFRKHIEEECETCRGNGFYCELCDSNKKEKNQLLFPFSEGVSMCSKCCFVFHKKCFDAAEQNCPSRTLPQSAMEHSLLMESAMELSQQTRSEEVLSQTTRSAVEPSPTTTSEMVPSQCTALPSAMELSRPA